MVEFNVLFPGIRLCVILARFIGHYADSTGNCHLKMRQESLSIKLHQMIQIVRLDFLICRNQIISMSLTANRFGFLFLPTTFVWWFLLGSCLGFVIVFFRNYFRSLHIE